jgi:hypothetical protein
MHPYPRKFDLMSSAMQKRSVVLELDAANQHLAGSSLADLFADGLTLHCRTGKPIDLAAHKLALIGAEPLPPGKGANAWDCLRHAEKRTTPYDHSLLDDVLPCADALLEWLEQTSRWHEHRQGFYNADVISLDAIEPPHICNALLNHDGRIQLESAASEMFGRTLRLHGPICAHRLTAGQGIGIHTDTPLPGEETHRIVLLLARDRAFQDGGHFVMLSDRVPHSARLIVPLQHNTAIAFRLTSNSYHAVTTIVRGTRFSVVASFR